MSKYVRVNSRCLNHTDAVYLRDLRRYIVDTQKNISQLTRTNKRLDLIVSRQDELDKCLRERDTFTKAKLKELRH